MKIGIIKNSFITALALFALVAAPVGLGVASAYEDVENNSEESFQWGGNHRTKTYVAIGDSVAAGLGLPQDPNATTEDRLCGRSTQAYSDIVAAELNHKLATVDASCQGATVLNLTSPQNFSTASIQPQLDAAFANGTPRLITLTIGANDVRWANFIGACFATTCDTAANTAAANAYLEQLRTNLRAALAEIEARSQGRPPTVVVTGYYNPMSQQCVSSSLTSSEITWIGDQTAALNQVLQEVTKEFRFARFAPVDFTGHDICSADPWIQRPGVPGEPAPFHPNAAGQQAIAQAVLDVLKKNY